MRGSVRVGRNPITGSNDQPRGVDGEATNGSGSEKLRLAHEQALASLLLVLLTGLPRYCFDFRFGAHVLIGLSLSLLGYHYQHSGAHGAVGLALLAAGTHSVQLAAQNASASQGKPPSKLGTSKPHSSASASPGPSSPIASKSNVSRAPSVKPMPISTNGQSQTPTTPVRPTFVSSPTSPRRSYAAATSQGLVSPTTATTPTTATATTSQQQQYANAWYQQQQQQHQQTAAAAGAYPYLPGYPYLPTQQPNSSRGPVYPPNVNNAAVAAAYYAQMAQQQQQQQPQRPTHQLLRTNSGGATVGAAPVPVVGTSAVTAVGSGSPHGEMMDVDAEMSG